MATATLNKPMTDRERRDKRELEKADLAANQKLMQEKAAHGRELASDNHKIEGLKDDAARAVVLGKPTEPFDDARRKLEDRNRHLQLRLAQLAGLDGEIARINARLRGELANPDLRTALYVSKRSRLWSERRRAEAQKEFGEVERHPALLRPDGEQQYYDPLNATLATNEVKLVAAELAEAERLFAEAVAEVERLQQAILDE